MKNLDKVNPFKTSDIKTDFGTVTTMVTEIGLSQHGSINCWDKTLLANYIYAKDETYHLVYTLMDNEGKHESFEEDDGILPKLFLSPNHEPYVSVQPYDPDNDLEISIPVFNRENTDLPKRNRPFLGDYIGTVKQFSIFFDVDIWSDTKHDKLLAIEFKNEAIKKKHNIKIPMPRENKVFISNNEIHLLTKVEKGWLHRQINESGKILRERLIQSNQKYFWQVLSLSFENVSYILCGQKGRISVEIISAKGECENKELADIGDGFFNTWRPVKIADGTYVIRFNGEFGNGWFTIRNDQLIELFYSKGESGYKNLLANKVLQMNNENLVIASLNKTTDNSYAVVFYPMTDRETKNRELIILNRVIVKE